METSHVATLLIPIIVLIAVFVVVYLRQNRSSNQLVAARQAYILGKRGEIINRSSSFMSFTFEGRMGRKNYWFGLFLSYGAGQAFSGVTSWPWAQVLVAVGMLVLIYRTTLISRRLYDMGLSAWWQAPFVVIQIVFIALGLFMTEAMSDKLLVLIDAELFGRILVLFVAAYFLFVLAIGLVPGRKVSNAYGDLPRPTPLFPSTM